MLTGSPVVRLQIKAVLLAGFGLVTIALMGALLSVMAFFWTASYTEYTQERVDVFEVEDKSMGSRRGRTVFVRDGDGRPVSVRFGSNARGVAGLNTGDRIRVRCRGFEDYCRIIEWRKL